MSNTNKRVNGVLQQLVGFGRDKSGQVALIFGLSAIPLFGAAGIAVDLARKNVAQTSVQIALDGAVMAASSAYAAGETTAAYEKAAQDFFDYNKPDGLTDTPTITISIDSSSGIITGTTSASLETTLTKIIGIDDMPLTSESIASSSGSSSGESIDAVAEISEVGLTSSASLPVHSESNKVEIALVLDFSNAMSTSVGSTTATFVNNITQRGVNENVKIGVVPYASEVFFSSTEEFWLLGFGSGTNTSCTRDRLYPYNQSASTPEETSSDPNQQTRFGWHKTEYSIVTAALPIIVPAEDYTGNCDTYGDFVNLVVRDLNTDHETTMTKLTEMTLYGGTHIALGVETGYHLLSPNVPFNNGAAYDATDTTKIAILVSGGEQTTNAFGESGTYTVENGEENLAALCTNMKADGIRILTVSFDINDDDTEDRLKTCASDNNDYFEVSDLEELATTFEKIRMDITPDGYVTQ